MKRDPCYKAQCCYGFTSLTMARLCSNLFFVVLHYLLVSASKRAVHMVYKPYGPRMCADLCQDLVCTFRFMKEDLSCRRTDINFPRASRGRSTDALFNCSETDNRKSNSTQRKDIPPQGPPYNSSNDDSTEDILKLRRGMTSTSPCDSDPGPVHPSQNTSLHQACEEGRLCIVKYILSHGLEEINCRDKDGRTPVMVAAEKGHLAVFVFLVSQNCNLTYFDDHNNTILHSACRGGNIDIVEQLLNSRKCDLETRGWKGLTPVMFAVYHCHGTIFDLLVRRGSNITSVDGRQMNILHFASLCGDADMVEYILSQNLLGLDSRDTYGITPVMSATMKGHVNVVDLLVKKGCNVTAQNCFGNNILHLACIHGHIEAVKYILVKALVDIDIGNYKGYTPVGFAALQCHAEIVDYLLRSNCRLTYPNRMGNNVLHLASLAGHVEIVKVILAQKTNMIESKEGNGRTPVILAAGACHKAVIELLIMVGCNLKAVDNNNNNLLHTACTGGNVTVVKYIVKLNEVSIESRNGNQLTPVMVASKRGHLNVVKFLRSEGCNMEKISDKNNNLLHMASSHGHVDMVKYILGIGGLDINSRGSFGRTPVMFASRKGHRGVVDLLLEKGCNPTLLDEGGENILHLASVSGDTETVDYILSLNILDINSRGWEGRTSVMLASMTGFVDVVDLLLKRGCNEKLLDKYKNNILHVACLGGYVDVVNYILINLRIDINSRGSRGRTPVMMAVNGNHEEVVSFLVRKGCDAKAVDDTGDNILHLACDSNRTDIVKYIIRHRLVDENQINRYGKTALEIAESRGYSKLITLFRTF